MRILTTTYGLGALFLTGMSIYYAIDMVMFNLRVGYGFTWSDLPFFLILAALPISVFTMFIFAHRFNAWMLSKLEGQRIRFTESGVQRQNRKQQEAILYSDIKEVYVKRDHRGDLARLNLRTETQDHTFDGLEDFEVFLQSLQDKLFKASVHEHRSWWHGLDRITNENFRLYITVCIALGLVTIFLQSAFPPLIFNLLQALFTVTIAIFALLKRPIFNGIASANAQRRYNAILLLLGAAMLAIIFF